MYDHDRRLQDPVAVEKPDPALARTLQQAIRGVDGEIRVCTQYFFQSWGNRAPTPKYRDMLLHTATEEIGHIEMLAIAADGSYPEGRWISDPSIDGRGEFTVFPNKPLGEEPILGPARPDSGAQDKQIG
ncbi:manganese catalase family protein [Sphingomonas sp. NPDC079357]|uniref:manganese catalase family protein n=1 Tax=Sphingomonas sp. NPDC079357 TaxID=3364518 RepID=UPI00384FA296